MPVLQPLSQPGWLVLWRASVSAALPVDGLQVRHLRSRALHRLAGGAAGTLRRALLLATVVVPVCGNCGKRYVSSDRYPVLACCCGCGCLLLLACVLWPAVDSRVLKLINALMLGCCSVLLSPCSTSGCAGLSPCSNSGRAVLSPCSTCFALFCGLALRAVPVQVRCCRFRDDDRNRTNVTRQM